MSLLDESPDRKELIAQLAYANGSAWFWVGLQMVAIVVLAAWIDWPRVANQPMMPLVAIGLVLLQTMSGVAMLWARKKKRIDNLRESTRFGQYDKHQLDTLFKETLRKLNLPNERLPVYIVNDKLLNAAAVRLGLGDLFRSLNGIYLNRQVLYKLSPAEVQDIMGHELGHYYRHFIAIDRFRVVTMVLGVVIGISIAQASGMEDLVGALLLAVTTGTLFWVSGLPWRRLAKTIEFLCDDFGAQVNGIVPSINGLMKIGAEAEIVLSVQAQVFARRTAGANLTIREIADAVQDSIPYGHVSGDRLLEAVERELKATDNDRVSIKGFLEYLWSSDSEDEEEVDEWKLQAIRYQSIPRLDWESLLPDDRIEFDRASIRKLVQMIEAAPGLSLVRATTQSDTHPALKQRILYLWKNRQAIEAATPS